MESQVSKFENLKSKKEELSRLFKIIEENEEKIAIKLQ